MVNLPEPTLNYSMLKEIEVIKKKYLQLHDIETKKHLYELLLQINRQLPAIKEEREYFSSYNDFDR